MLTIGREPDGACPVPAFQLVGQRQISLDTPAATRLSTTVVVMGRYQSRPNNRN